MQFDFPTYEATQMFTPEEDWAMDQDFDEEGLYEPWEEESYFNSGLDDEFDDLADHNSDFAIY